MNKSIAKKITLLFLSVIMIFSSSCSKGGNPSFANNEKQTAMGRYVEKTLNFPCENVKGMKNIIKKSDGSIDCYLYFEEEPLCALYNTGDGINWNKIDIPWYDEIVSMEYQVMEIAYDKNNNIYTLVVGGGNWDFKIFKVTKDNKLEEIKMDWKQSDIEGQKVYIKSMKIANNGDLILSQGGKGIVQYSSGGVFKNQYGALRDERFTVSGDNIFLIDKESSGVMIYDANTYELKKSVSYDNMTYEANLSSGKDGSIYLTDRSGVYRLAEGGSLWERIIDGELTSLSIPSQYFSGITEGMDDSFYIDFGDSESNCTIAKYEYDENISTMPGTELVVYTLKENKTLRQAAGELQRKNSDIKVNIRVGIDNDSSITKSDAIRTLNTELLAGKGPDLILLDGMPIDSYISKGVLTDLTDVLLTLKENGEDLLDNVKNTYKKDSKVFAVPAKFILPAMWVDEEYSNQMKNLKQLADFAEKHNDKQIIPCSSIEDLIRIFCVTSAPHWIDDKGNIKEEEFMDFLKDIRRISDVDKNFMKEDITSDEEIKGSSTSNMSPIISMAFESMKNTTDIFSWAFGRSYSYCDYLRGYNSVNLPYLAIKERNGGIVIPLPGQVDNAFVPVSSIGVNSNSAHIDIAKEFVGVMLSSSVQNARTYDGFPINIKSLDYGAEGKGNNYICFGTTNDEPYEEEELVGTLPEADELSKVKEVCLLVKTPSIIDETLLEMIISETKGYFTGEKTIEKAVEDVKEKTKLYLSE